MKILHHLDSYTKCKHFYPDLFNYKNLIFNLERKDSYFLAFSMMALFLFSMVPFGIHNANATTPQLMLGSLGSSPGQLHLPRGIAVDDSGNIYVADNRNNRVEKFDSSGRYASSFDIGGIPEGIAVDRSGNINVVDRNNMTIEKFSPTGTLLSSFGSTGSAAGQLGNAERIAIDSSDNIYVTDVNVVQKFNSKGIFMSQLFANDTTHCCMNAMGIAIDSSNNIYIADMGSHQIIKFNSTGSILSVFNATFSVPRISSTPQDVAVDAAGNIYVADTDNGRIVKLNSTGHQLSALEISGVPVGITVKNDKIYATDLGNNRVDVFLLSQFVNNDIGTSSSTQRKETPLNQNSTALDAAIKLATSDPQFQSLVKGYNYTFSSDFEESGPLSTGGIGLTDHGFAFELYSGPVNPGKAVKVVEVLEDPALVKILNVTSYPAVYNYGPMIPSATPISPPGSNPQNNTVLSPLTQFKQGVLAQDVKCYSNFQLIFKTEDGSPACVTPDSATKLVQRGWAKEIVSTPVNAISNMKPVIQNYTGYQSKIIPGPLVLSSCGGGRDGYHSFSNILNSTGFHVFYNITNSSTGFNDDYVIEPGHAGTITYVIDAGSSPTPYMTNSYFQKELNITNYAVFYHYVTDYEELLHNLSVTIHNGDYESCFKRPNGSCAGLSGPITGPIQASVVDHPGVIVSFDPASELLQYNDTSQGKSSQIITMTVSVDYNSPQGTYWVVLSPEECLGGKIFLLTIGNEQYHELNK